MTNCCKPKVGGVAQLTNFTPNCAFKSNDCANKDSVV